MRPPQFSFRRWHLAALIIGLFSAIPATVLVAATHGIEGMPATFASVAKVARPAVCHIFAAQDAAAGTAPLDDFSRRFFGEVPPGNRPRRSLGSGFIISTDGYIVTNTHVIRDATRIRVRLANKDEYEAKLVGTDPKTDIALIKIQPRQPLPVLRLGSSAALEVGDWVIAVGNPFGLAQTVTAGIVSATGRVIGAGPYDDFIQTDASINPGNSGGPLLNVDGEVIGINSAIFSRSGGNIGIGFAIPIDLGRSIIDQLRQHGRVVRAWLGVSVQNMTPQLAKSFGLAQPRGVVIADVVRDGPADRAGLRRGDVIVGYQGRAILETQHFPAVVAETPVGTKVEVKVLRTGTERTFSVIVGELPEPKVVPKQASEAAWGLKVADLTPRLAGRLGLPPHAHGVVITAVTRGSSAGEAGLLPGDILREVNRQEIKTARDYRAAAATSREQMLLLVERGDRSSFVVLSRD